MLTTQMVKKLMIVYQAMHTIKMVEGLTTNFQKMVTTLMGRKDMILSQTICSIEMEGKPLTVCLEMPITTMEELHTII